jgi:hypothetical protein
MDYLISIVDLRRIHAHIPNPIQAQHAQTRTQKLRLLVLHCFVASGLEEGHLLGVVEGLRWRSLEGFGDVDFSSLPGCGCTMCSGLRVSHCKTHNCTVSAAAVGWPYSKEISKGRWTEGFFWCLQWTRDCRKEGDLGKKIRVPAQFMRGTTVGTQVY